MKRLILFAFAALVLPAALSPQGPTLPFGFVPQTAGGGGGTFTFVQHNTSAAITSSGSSVTIPSTTLHNAAYAFCSAQTSVSETVTSITGACNVTWARSSRSTSSSMNQATEIWYCPDLTASATSIAVNYTSSTNTMRVSEVEFHSTASIVYDSGAGTTNAAASGTALTGATMTNTGAGMSVTYLVGNGCQGSSQYFGSTPILDTTFIDVGGNPIFYKAGVPAGSNTFTCTATTSGGTFMNASSAMK